MTLGHLIQAWRSFWFEPQSPAPVALFRIFYGVLILQTLLIHLGANFLTWYGSHSIVTIESVKHYFWFDEPRFDLLLLFGQNDWLILCFYYSLVVAACCVTVGLFTRLSASYLCLSLISMHHHDPFNINGGDAFLKLVGIFLACSHAGDMYSVDRLINDRLGIAVPQKSSPWAQRMIQVQLAIVYCQTFFCKIAGVQWLDATAVYYATRLDDMYRFPMPFLDNMVFLRFLSWYTLLVEFAMWTVVWLKEFRYFALLAALFLHLGIDATINLPVFEWAFIATLVTFVEPHDAEKFLSKLQLWLGRRIFPAKILTN